MSDPSFLHFLSVQLGQQLPLLLVYLVGAILALIHVRRMPSVAVLALVGCLILLFTHLAQPVVLWSLPRELSPAARATLSSFVVLIIYCFRALGAALLVAAVFIGRPSPRAGLGQ